MKLEKRNLAAKECPISSGPAWLSFIYALLLAAVVMPSQAAPEQGHSADSHAEASVEIAPATRGMIPIVSTRLEPQRLPITVSAPGEVHFNEYKSADISPLINANVVQRLARLGDKVEVSQALVTLVSVQFAQAQGSFEVASREWQRVEKLGKSTVGSKRFIQARVAFRQARIHLETFGLELQDINEIESGKNPLPLGQFQLKAPIAGTILSDNFKLSQHIAAGQTLFVISDEASIWVEAHLAPGSAAGIVKGMPARVRLADQWHPGRVIQRHHLLDEATRTIPVRIEVQLPPGDDHHRGEFGQAEIVTGYTQPMLAVPESALAQNEKGQWIVFVETEPGHFTSRPVNRGEIHAGLVSISGVEAGSMVTTEGAFFLAAELAKGDFDAHAH